MKRLVKRFCVITADISLGLGLLASCGTEVEVGENAEKGKPRPAYGDEDAVAGIDGDDIILQPGSDGVIPGTGGDPIIGGTDGDPILGGGDGGLVGNGNEPSGGDDGTGGGGDGGTGGGDTGTTGGSAGTDGGTGGTGGGTGGTGGSGGSTGGGVPLTCYGPNPVLPGDFRTFCEDIPTDLKSEFASAYKLVCDNQRLVNLALFDVCNWNGDPATILKHRKILSMTDRADTSLSEFYLLTAYGVKSQSSPDEHISLIRREMTDPGFASNYVQIRNSTITNVSTLSDNHYQYSVSLANSAATVSFRANLVFWRISDTMSVVFDYAFANKVIIRDHKFIRFFVKTSASTSRIVGLDEKLLEDGGNHDVAYTNLMEVLKQRMTKDYVNSTRD